MKLRALACPPHANLGLEGWPKWSKWLSLRFMNLETRMVMCRTTIWARTNNSPVSFTYQWFNQPNSSRVNSSCGFCFPGGPKPLLIGFFQSPSLLQISLVPLPFSYVTMVTSTKTFLGLWDRDTSNGTCITKPLVHPLQVATAAIKCELKGRG